MHLDTVFTQIDVDKFTYHPGIMGTLKVFEITSDGEGGLNVKERNASLEKILEDYLHRKITLIPCAGGDKIGAEGGRLVFCIKGCNRSFGNCFCSYTCKAVV